MNISMNIRRNLTFQTKRFDPMQVGQFTFYVEPDMPRGVYIADEETVVQLGNSTVVSCPIYPRVDARMASGAVVGNAKIIAAIIEGLEDDSR